MIHTLYINRFEKEFERASSSALPQDDGTLPIESDTAALKGLVAMVIESSDIKDKTRAVDLLSTDRLVQQRFLENAFTDPEGGSIDPTAFLLERLNVLDEAVAHTVVRTPQEKDMAVASETWHNDNRDGN
jgi:hypothetical protein